MHISPVPDDDPTIAVVRAAARSSLLSLRDDLVAAERATADASAAMPSTTLDWFGPASQALHGALDRLGAVVDDALADLGQALPLLDGAIR